MNQIKRFTDQNTSSLFLLPVLFDPVINTNQYHAGTWCNRLLQICDRKESSLHEFVFIYTVSKTRYSQKIF